RLTGELSRSGSILFELAVHIGTLGAVIIFYRERIFSIIDTLKVWSCGGFRIRDDLREDLQFFLFLAVGSLPTAVVGLFFRDRISSLFDSPSTSSVLLMVTGVFLLLGKDRGTNLPLTWKSALLIGAAQAIAIMPGCSRSGWTITTALLLGVGFRKAAEYSFLLSIPPITFGFLLELGAFPGEISSRTAATLVIGALVSFLSGWLALRLLLGILRRGTFHRFAYYLMPAGGAAFIYFNYF
ncbi:MAG: undecaprenyl-diphosphate phosphatase, partial [Candidatus Krumholzibacteriota bacterium]